jgi:hypothetical protein
MDWQELTTREWAAVAWTVVVVVASVATREATHRVPRL